MELECGPAQPNLFLKADWGENGPVDNCPRRQLTITQPFYVWFIWENKLSWECLTRGYKLSWTDNSTGTDCRCWYVPLTENGGTLHTKTETKGGGKPHLKFHNRMRTPNMKTCSYLKRSTTFKFSLNWSTTSLLRWAQLSPNLSLFLSK